MRTISSRFGLALALGALFAASAGCQFIASVDRETIPGEGGAGGASTGGGEGGTNTGGGGGQGGGDAPRCDDMAQNGAETDVDCGGGGECAACAIGKGCKVGSDCETGGCANEVCVSALLISEVLSRGPAGAGYEFIELYNTTDSDVTLDQTWKVQTRDVDKMACEAVMPADRWLPGAGDPPNPMTLTVPAHGHVLLASVGYNGSPGADATYPVGPAGFLDAGSVVLLHNDEVVDALCFHYDMQTQELLTTCSVAYTCEGASFENPHNDTNGTNNNVSLERKPGGAQGNAVDTGDNSADFAVADPANPQSVESAATP